MRWSRDEWILTSKSVAIQAYVQPVLPKERAL